jgi:hypothetical protein
MVRTSLLASGGLPFRRIANGTRAGNGVSRLDRLPRGHAPRKGRRAREKTPGEARGRGRGASTQAVCCGALGRPDHAAAGVRQPKKCLTSDRCEWYNRAVQSSSVTSWFRSVRRPDRAAVRAARRLLEGARESGLGEARIQPSAGTTPTPFCSEQTSGNRRTQSYGAKDRLLNESCDTTLEFSSARSKLAGSPEGGLCGGVLTIASSPLSFG